MLYAQSIFSKISMIRSIFHKIVLFNECTQEKYILPTEYFSHDHFSRDWTKITFVLCIKKITFLLFKMINKKRTYQSSLELIGDLNFA